MRPPSHLSLHGTVTAFRVKCRKGVLRPRKRARHLTIRPRGFSGATNALFSFSLLSYRLVHSNCNPQTETPAPTLCHNPPPGMAFITIHQIHLPHRWLQTPTGYFRFKPRQTSKENLPMLELASVVQLVRTSTIMRGVMSSSPD